MKENYLLKTKNAERLYFEYAKTLPIIDFHNHVSVADIAADRRYENLYELWLASTHTSTVLCASAALTSILLREMRCPSRNSKKYCEVFPYLAGNPVYDWSRMELSRIFGIHALPTKENARYIFDKCGEMFSSNEFSNNAILSRFRIEYQSPVATLFDSSAP